MLKDFYDKETEPVVNLEAFYGEPKKLTDKCLIIFSKEIHDYLLENYSCEEIGIITACNGNTTIYQTEYKGEKIAFYLTGIGAPMASATCYEVHWQTGATKFIMFGSCGSLDADVSAGKFIVPTKSYRGEGTSFYYAPADDYIDIKTADRLAEIFDELKVPFVKGPVWTTDSMLRETKGLVSKRRAEGCIAVEMELAGVQALCDFYGLTLYDFLEAGDVLSDSGYEIEGLDDANHNLGKLFVALDIALRI
ncbi:Phosphorylase superfamily protein [Pseudobutyrivibrio sp. YE44]|uniref:nucleoside phosphorylase n=1 Tax=Pseudobutyrivibrio sp. YE44 TaxID=1520802 RepID=UPI000887540F|nr:nucleoside phosphorylase [Pseudobutyrivibrio sp. YE44]SDB13604.1 Phosphorylase superfamily protein [Pseudobutyrivibrio sp. YE44]